MVIVKVKDLVKSYGKIQVLNNMNFEIEEGEIFGLLGPNGSGKTTTINCILSLLKYQKGEIELFGKPMSPDAYDIKQKIGLVMQNVAVFDELTVYENVDYFCGLYIYDKVKRKKLVDEAINFVGLDKYIKYYPKKLSGGLLRRLNIACGIAHKPQLIILDEPTVAVDPQSRNNILEGIKKLNEQGATIIYTSHYMEEVEQICSRIAIIDNGKVIACGTKDELKATIDYGEKLSIELTQSQDNDLLEKIKKLDGVYSAFYEGSRLHVNSKPKCDILAEVLDFLKSNNIAYGIVYSEPPTLNDVFLEITGRKLRD